MESNYDTVTVEAHRRQNRTAYVEGKLRDYPAQGSSGTYYSAEAETSDPETAAAYHFARFMEALGIDPLEDPHLKGTPARVAAMYAEVLTGGEPFQFTTFAADGADQLILVSNIPFASFCAHHFLPFTGTAHIGYIPNGKIAGLSKLPRALRYLAAQPQVQERLTEQVADLLAETLRPRAVGVVLQARHECMELRGVRAVGSITTTSAMRGFFRDDDKARAEFFYAVELAT